MISETVFTILWIDLDDDNVMTRSCEDEFARCPRGGQANASGAHGCSPFPNIPANYAYACCKGASSDPVRRAAIGSQCLMYSVTLSYKKLNAKRGQRQWSLSRKGKSTQLSARELFPVHKAALRVVDQDPTFSPGSGVARPIRSQESHPARRD